MTIDVWKKTVGVELVSFYDESKTGELCAVPCWPTGPNGDASDCPVNAVLLGVMGPDGLFRAEEHHAFNPMHASYVCLRCLNP